MDFDGPWGFGWFGHMLGNILWGVLSFFMFLVVVGLIFLLVRFLLVATRAAHLYLQQNSPAPTAPAAAPASAPTPPAASTPAAAAPTTATATTPPASTATTKPATTPAATTKPATAAKPATTAKPATAPATKPAPRTRTPKTPPTT